MSTLGGVTVLLVAAVVLPLVLFVVGSRAARPLERRTRAPRVWVRDDGRWLTSEFGLGPGEYLAADKAVLRGERLDDPRQRAAAHALAERRLRREGQLPHRYIAVTAFVVAFAIIAALIILAVRRGRYGPALNAAIYLAYLPLLAWFLRRRHHRLVRARDLNRPEVETGPGWSPG